jgi:SAM-dependent methyltransferase
MFSASDGYERFMGRWSRALAAKVVEFAGVTQGDDVLDVGCGTGALAFTAAAVPNTRVIGVDLSPELIHFATAHVDSDRVRFEVGQADALKFPAAQFDKALSQLVLNFVPDATAALREMIRVTRAGGVVAAAVWDYDAGMAMLRTFWDEAITLAPESESLDERHMPLCRLGELASLWESHGLRDVKEQAISIDMRFDSFDDYWQPFLCGQGPAGSYAASLPEHARATLMQRLRQRLIGESDRAFVLRSRAWAVRGVAPAR